jgi:hypothetical protein
MTISQQKGTTCYPSRELNIRSPATRCERNSVNKGAHKAGNRAFRRYRNTYPRNRANCPRGLYRHWMAHADESMSDLYDKIKEDDEFRLEWAEKCGLGFELPNCTECTECTEN